MGTNAGERTGKRMQLPASQSLEKLLKCIFLGSYLGTADPESLRAEFINDCIIDKPWLSQLRACDFGQVTQLGFSKLQFPHLWNQDANAHFSGFFVRIK